MKLALILALAVTLGGCSSLNCWAGGIGEQPSRCGPPAPCTSDPGGCKVTPP